MELIVSNLNHDALIGGFEYPFNMQLVFRSTATRSTYSCNSRQRLSWVFFPDEMRVCQLWFLYSYAVLNYPWGWIRRRPDKLQYVWNVKPVQTTHGTFWVTLNRVLWFHFIRHSGRKIYRRNKKQIAIKIRLTGAIRSRQYNVRLKTNNNQIWQSKRGVRFFSFPVTLKLVGCILFVNK